MLGELKHTERGFESIAFEDYYNQKCSLQQSSLALYEPPGTSALWLGVDTDLEGENVCARMHLSLEQVRELIKHLQKWVEDGTIGLGFSERSEEV
jgi:hypothetical protein